MVDENKLQSISIKTNETVIQNTNFLKQNSSEGKKIFFNTCFDKNHLKTVIAWFLDQYGEKVTVDLVETLKQVGFHQATLAGVSLGVDDLQIPPQKKTLLSQASVKMNAVSNAIQAGNVTSVEKSQRLIDTWNQTSETLRQTAVQNFRTTNPVNPVYMMAFSGARGNISQVRQLVAMRGLMADPQGAILEFPIQSNFREGLTITEYLISCYGARKGLVDTALRTATSGYLTRRLVDAVQHVVVNISDCETKKGIILKDKNLEQRLLGRVLFQDLVLNEQTLVKKNTLISQPLAKQIASKYKSIVVRSPLTCQTEKSVCQFCYGVDLSQGKLVSLGEAVGIIAAQSIGEPGTQLTMRTFHTGGVGVFSDQAMKSFVAPFEGKIEFLEPLAGLFVRTPHGNIVYLVKQKISNENKPILRIVSSQAGQKASIFQIMNSDVPSGSLLWVKQGEIVQTGQLLLQASRLQTTTQEMPESSHPVRSTLSGEIFFQSMSIRVVEEEKRLLSKVKKKKQQNSINSHINQKEISPKIPTLIELGNFWIFSTFVQKEKHFCNSFFVPGDLVSGETPIQEYNVHVLKSGQLRKFDSSLVFGRNWFEFLVSKIHYSGLFYFLQSFTNVTSRTLVAYTSNSKYTGFTWYPFFTDISTDSSGYFSVLHSQNSFSANRMSETSDNSKITSQETTNLLNLSYACAPHKVLTLKQPGHSSFEKLAPVVFLLATQNLSQKGFFQYMAVPNLHWNFKNCFENFISKNPKKKSVRTTLNIAGETFLQKGLIFSQKLFFNNPSLKIIKKNKIWFYLPETKLDRDTSSLLPGTLLEPGKKFETIRFSNSYISTNFINSTNVRFLKSKNRKNFRFYTIDNFLSPTNKFVEQNSTDWKKIARPSSSKNTFPETFTKTFCFYKENLEKRPGSEKEFGSFSFTLKSKISSSYFLIFQKNNYTFISNSNFFKQKFISLTKNISKPIITSPTFTKQSKTEFTREKNVKPSFKIVCPKNSSWSTVQTFLKIEIKVKRPKSFLKKEDFKESIVFQSQPIFVPKFNLFFYQPVKFKNTRDFRFETFSRGWVFPNSKITTAFLTSQKLGEFRFAKSKQKETTISLLRNQDKTSITLPTEKISIKTIDVGTKVRWGQEIFPGFATPASGQITKLTLNTLTLRRGVPLIASIRGLVHISHKDLVQKNDLLITLRSRRLQTEDIVQGIPKIEQLFEARETQGGEIIQNNMHTVLQNFFIRAKKVRPVNEAVQLSLSYIQKFLVENILEAYSNQGVNIAEKHVEVVVRQMTARVRITTGGDTGFLPGELVQIKWIEKLNLKLKELGRREAQYEPVILGITKSVLQSESFLLAASFQQVSKVLVRSALSKKTDFLRGLHENILVGQPIPAGTGIIGVNPVEESLDDSFDNLEFSGSPNLQFRLDL